MLPNIAFIALFCVFSLILIVDACELNTRPNVSRSDQKLPEELLDLIRLEVGILPSIVMLRSIPLWPIM